MGMVLGQGRDTGGEGGREKGMDGWMDGLVDGYLTKLRTNGISWHILGFGASICSRPRVLGTRSPRGSLAQQKQREVMKPRVMKALPLFPTPGSSPCHNNEGPEPHTGIVEACGVLFSAGGGDTGTCPLSPSWWLLHPSQRYR